VGKSSDGRAQVLYSSMAAKTTPLLGTKSMYPYDLKLLLSAGHHHIGMATCVVANPR
jgi:hypothetical protein